MRSYLNNLKISIKQKVIKSVLKKKLYKCHSGDTIILLFSLLKLSPPFTSLKIVEMETA